jgi:hypothetical protein
LSESGKKKAASNRQQATSRQAKKGEGAKGRRDKGTKELTQTKKNLRSSFKIRVICVLKICVICVLPYLLQISL